MLSFENICFLKVGNVDISFKLSSREFHSLMADGIQDFCEILVRGMQCPLIVARSHVKLTEIGTSCGRG